MSRNWFIRRGSSEEGPHSSASLKQLAREGKVRPNDQIRRQDRTDWVRAGDVRELFAVPPPPAEAAKPMNPPPEAPGGLPAQKPSGIGPPPLPPTASTSGASCAGKESAVAELYRGSFESRFIGDPAVLRHEALTPKKLEGIATYANLGSGESILFAVDSTIFGVATEGFTFSDRAVAWAFPDGNHGRIAYDSIPAYSVQVETRPGTPQRLVFGASSKHQVLCKSLKQQSVVALAEFLAAAARVTQGLRPEEALPKARELAAANDTAAAVALWKAVLNDDVSQFPAILADVAQCRTGRAKDALLAAFHADLEARASNKEAGWLLPRAGDRPEEITAEELESRWRSGLMRPESRVRHVSDGQWTTAGKVPVLERQRTVYVSDTGSFDEDQFLACVRGMAAEGLGFDELLVFGPTSAKVDDASGKPILHAGLTTGELVLAWLPTGGAAVVERSPAIGIVWKSSEANGVRQIEVATARRSATLTLPPSAGTGHFIRVASDVFLRAAEESLKQERRTEAVRLLDRVVPTDATSRHVEDLRSRARADEEVLCVYDGGHPDHVDACLGTLRLDGEGFEFMSIAPESQVFFRVPYEKVVDFAAPQRGALPADLQKSLLGPNSLLSAGLGVAAACVIPGGALLVRSLSGSMGGDRSAGQPINRLTAVVSLAGTPYKIYFDVVGASVAEMSQKAKTFWSRTARMKSRFLKPGNAQTPARAPDAADAEVKALLREIRDSLQLLIKVVSLDLATARPREPGVLAAVQLEALRRSLGQELPRRLGLPAVETAGTRRAESIVIACPKCGSRIRASRPGVIKCGACETLARLGPNLFAVKPAATAMVTGNGAAAFRPT